MANFRNISEDLAARIANGLGIAMPAKALRRKTATGSGNITGLVYSEKLERNIAGRCIGVLVSDGSDAAAIDKLRTAIAKKGAITRLVAPKLNGITFIRWYNHHRQRVKFAGTPSQLFDAVAVILPPMPQPCW